MAKSKFTKVGMLRGLIDAAYNSVPQQPQQASLNFGMSKADIDSIYDGYSTQNQAQSTPEIPKLEDNTVNPVQNTATPTIADELERMRKVKAENKPLSESEQRAVDMYLSDLEKASTPDYKPDFKAEIDRMNALANDETVNWSEGEKKAREDYLTRLQSAYEDEQKKNAPVPVRSTVTNKSVKTPSKQKKDEKITEEPVKKDQTNFTKTMSANEKRDYDRAMKAISQAKGRALSANEQRDMERAMSAIENAKQTTEEGSKNLEEQYADIPEFGELNKLVRTTPTPTPTPKTAEEMILNPNSVMNTSKYGYDDKGFPLNMPVDNESTSEKVDRYISPDVKMTKEEKKEAKQILKDYLDENPKAKRAFNTNNPNEAMALQFQMTDEERNEFLKMSTLANKTNSISSVAMGAIGWVPFLKKLGDKTNELMGGNPETNFSTQFENAQKQNPLLYMGGEMGAKMGLYSSLSPYLEEITPLANLTNGLGTALAGGNATVGNVLGKIARGTVADALLDTLPTEAENYANGMRGADLITDAAGNLALNTLFNAGAEAIPYVWDAAKGLFNKNNVDQAADVIRNADELNPLEMAAKNADVADNAAVQSRQAADEITRLQEQIPEVPAEGITNPVVKEATKSAEDQNLIKQAEDAFRRDTDADLYRKLMNNEITYDEFMQNAKDPNLKKLASGGIPGEESAESAIKNELQPYNEPILENGDKVSRFATNSMRRGTNLTPEEYEKNIDLNQFKYESKSEKQSMEDAWKMIEDEGVDNLKSRLLSEDAKDLTQSEIDALMSITRTNNATARAMEAAGEDASALRAETNAIYKKLRKQESSNAQALQALAKWTRNTPEGMLMHAENIVNGNLKPKKSGLQKKFDKFMKKSKDMDFSPEFESKFMEEAEKLFQLGDMDSREAKDIMARLGRLVNEQIPVKLPEKVQAYLMDNMLGNFRTLITRNAGGNVGLNAMEQLVTRPLAAAIDSGFAKVTGKRTQAGLSGKALKEYIEGFGKGLADEAHDLKTGLHTARTGENTLERAIQANRHVFKTKIPDKLDSLVKNGLSVGDRPFYEATYKQTLGDYYRLREKGVMGDVLQNLSDEEFKMYAETAAKLNGLSAVYQNDSTLSNALLKLKNGLGELSQGMVGVDILSQFSMPFVKTPANVVDRAIDYSPLGAIRNTASTIREAKGGNFDQNRFVNETARNIIGTGLMGGAGAAAANGRISGKYSDKANIKQAQKDAGQQEYAWNYKDLQDKKKQMDIGWIPVLGSNAVAAAAFMDAFKNGDGGLGENLLEGVAAGGEALFDQSMFQGLQRLFGSGESFNSDDSLPKNMMNVVKSGLGQAIPSLARQIGQVVDPYQRDIGNSNEGLSFAGMDNYAINSLIKDIPFVRQNALAPKVDLSGNLIEENQGRSIPRKIIEDMILPGKITEIKENALDQEAIRLENSTGGTDAYRPKASRSAVEGKEGGESLYDNRGFELNPPKRMSNDEYVEYEQRFGKEITDIGNAVMNSDIYKKADNETKESMLKEAYSAVKNSVNSDYNGKGITGMAKEYHASEDGVNTILSELEAKHNEYGIKPDAYKEMKANNEDFTPYEGYKNAQAQLGISDNEKYREAYASGGKEGLAKEAQYQSAIKDMGVSDSKENREAFNASGVNGLQGVANTKQSAIDSGYVTKDGQANTEAYQNAITVLGNDSSAKNYKKVSDTMKQKGYTKQEQYIPYLENDGSLTDKQKGQYAYLYGGKPKEGSSADKALDKGYDYYYWYKLLQQVDDWNNNGKRDKGDRIKELYSWGWDQNTPEYDFFINGDLKY